MSFPGKKTELSALPPDKRLFGQYKILLFTRAVVEGARNESSVLSEGF